MGIDKPLGERPGVRGKFLAFSPGFCHNGPALSPPLKKGDLGGLLNSPLWQRGVRGDLRWAAGFYVPENFPEQRFPKLQILTVTDLFAGKKLDYPRWWSEETFKKAARQHKGPNDAERQRDLLE